MLILMDKGMLKKKEKKQQCDTECHLSDWYKVKGQYQFARAGRKQAP